MGLLENQISAALTIERGEAAISTVVESLTDKYAVLNPQGKDEFRETLELLVKVCKDLGAFNEFQQTHLRNG
jgi:hypothetical protein